MWVRRAEGAGRSRQDRKEFLVFSVCRLPAATSAAACRLWGCSLEGSALISHDKRLGPRNPKRAQPPEAGRPEKAQSERTCRSLLTELQLGERHRTGQEEGKGVQGTPTYNKLHSPVNKQLSSTPSQLALFLNPTHSTPRKPNLSDLLPRSTKSLRSPGKLIIDTQGTTSVLIPAGLSQSPQCSSLFRCLSVPGGRGTLAHMCTVLGVSAGSIQGAKCFLPRISLRHLQGRVRKNGRQRP